MSRQNPRSGSSEHAASHGIAPGEPLAEPRLRPAGWAERTIRHACDCFVKGLTHCACSHHPAYPDLAACILGHNDRRAETKDEL